MRAILAAMAAVVFLWTGPAGADQRDTLAEINQRGRILVGCRDASMPFSYVVPTPLSTGGESGIAWSESSGWMPLVAGSAPRVVGYSLDYADHIVAAVKKELNRPDLAVEYVLVTPQNQFALLAAGGYDFECGSTANSTSRQREAAFSNSIFVAGARLLTGRDSGIKDYADLRGKTLAVAAGAASEKLLALMNEAEGLEMKIVPAESQAEAFRLVESGEAHAFFFDDALLAGELARAAEPDKWVLVGRPQVFEAYGCLLPQGDARFKKVADAAVAEVQTSGEGLKIFEKWFQSPIPPQGLNLGFELSPALKHLLQNPNDQPYQ